MEHNHRIGGHFVRRIALYGIVIEISAPRALAPWLALLFRAYPPAPPETATDIRIVVTRKGQMWRVMADDQAYEQSPLEAPKAGIAACQVEFLVVSEALKRWSCFVHAHAALVATPTRSALLVGRSASGKSTTSLALALKGLDLYTDDLALLDRATLRPFCLPRPVKLDSRARRLLRTRGLVLPPRASLGESIDRTVLPGLPPMNAPGPPLTTAIFFVGNRFDRAEVRPLTRAEAAMRVARQSASEWIDSAGPSEGVVALVNAVRCYELSPGDLDSTVQAVLDLLEAPEVAVAAEERNQAGTFAA
jgi:hypothetical protein